MWVGATQVISQSKLRMSARMRVLEMENSPRENTRENFLTEPRERAPASPSGNGAEWAGGCVSPPPGFQGPAGPCRQTQPAGLRSPSRAAGRSWPQLRPSLGPPRAKRAHLHGLRRGRPFPSSWPPWPGFGHRDECVWPGRRSRSRR